MINYTNFILDELQNMKKNVTLYQKNINYALDDLKNRVDESKFLIEDNINDPEYISERAQCKRFIQIATEQILEMTAVQEKLKRLESFLKTL